MNDDEQAIRNVVETWMDATRRGDLDTVLDLMTDDIVFLTPGRAPFGKQEFREQSAGMGGVEFDGRAEIREIEIAGGWAWIRNHIDLTATPTGGQPMRRSGDTLSILRKGGDGQWRLARDANFVS
jgi:uncharacterized protein (TIGR02246 family)